MIYIYSVHILKGIVTVVCFLPMRISWGYFMRQEDYMLTSNVVRGDTPNGGSLRVKQHE
jgi:hypothetical protein